MEINTELVQRLAQLSKLQLSEIETVKMCEDLQKMLVMVQKLEEINTDNILPLKCVHELENIFREDEIISTTNKNELLSNAPFADEHYFKVPKVIQK
jgi:aspartyl-tRNA(Asn)/glutamyl-tRNA(Gln) amidotransferase subunit C